MKPVLLTSIALVLSAGCFATADETEAANVSEALELDYGGFDMTDEEPAFGLDTAFDDLQLLDEGEPSTDPMEADPEVAAMRDLPDAVVYHTMVQWGRFPLDVDAADPANWSGRIRVSRGAIIVRRTIAFEGPTDNLLPRIDRRIVGFTSATLPHHDGIIVSVVDPLPRASEPITLTYESVDGTKNVTVPLRNLVGNPQTLLGDDLGNRMVAGATAVARDLCSHGFIHGRWQRLDEGVGRLYGAVVGAHGVLHGHVRGIYGHRSNGDRVFFGKYIDREGRFRGIFRGTYGDGEMRGAWVSRAGEVGALGGRYSQGHDGDPETGPFLARYLELSCDRFEANAASTN